MNVQWCLCKFLADLLLPKLTDTEASTSSVVSERLIAETSSVSESKRALPTDSDSKLHKKHKKEKKNKKDKHKRKSSHKDKDSNKNKPKLHPGWTKYLSSLWGFFETMNSGGLMFGDFIYV